MDSTLMIPTYNRSTNLQRTLSFILSQKTKHKLNIMILDGSTNSEDALNNKNYCRNNDLEYYYKPELGALERVAFGCDKIKTRTVSLLDDEDLLDINGFFECVEFLESNPKYISACGDYWQCISEESRISYRRIYNIDSIQEDNKIKILWENVYGYNTAFIYDVFETDAFMKIFTTVSDNSFSVEPLGEISVNCLSLLLGYHKRIYTNFKIRMLLPPGIPAWSLEPPFCKRAFMPSKYNLNLENDLQKFKDMILKFLPKNTIEKQEYILEMIATYYVAFFMILELDIHKEIRELVQKYDLNLKREVIRVNPDLIGTPISYAYSYKIDDSFIDENDRICIYGAGEIGEWFYKQLVQNGKKNILFFVTSKASNIKYHCTKKVIELSELDIDSFDYVILGSIANRESFKKNLLDKGVSESKIIETDGVDTFSYTDIHKICTNQ